MLFQGFAKDWYMKLITWFEENNVQGTYKMPKSVSVWQDRVKFNFEKNT